MIRVSFAILTLLFLCEVSAIFYPESDPNQPIGHRKGKILSLFQIVQFPNDSCNGSGNKNGTCYTSTECTSRGGTNGGSCASGYGICCTFTIRCGGTTSENCTFFESVGTETGSCIANICPCNTNICQMRLDFNTFVISGPSSSTTTTASILNGIPVQTAANGAAATPATQCLTDTFSVSNPSGSSPPTICGTNTGEHLYVDANSNQCTQLSFALAAAAANAAARSWSIKVTQYSCDFNNLAPPGCDQYFFGANTNIVRTFNYNGGNGYHLANQDQNICVRRERGTCRICWSTMANADFMVSGMAAGGKTGIGCCGYGTGKKTTGFDCVMIPSASKMTLTNGLAQLLKISAFCGRSNGLVTANGGNAATICSFRTPFQIRFLSDQYEFQNEAMSAAVNADRGFQLAYILTGNNCN